MEPIKRGPGRPRLDPPRVKVKVEPRFGKGKERPQMWLIGEDAGSYKHSMYHPWQLSKAQAKFRDEEWDLSFEEYYELWKDDWNNRGRLPHNMCMTREDVEKPWDSKNTIITSRHDHLKRLGDARTEQLSKIPVEPKVVQKRGRKPGQKYDKPVNKKPGSIFSQYWPGR